jgi:hypothetical protein
MKILRMIFLSVLLVAFGQAALAQCPDAIGQWTTNAMLIWNPAFGGSMPADYPDLLCGATTGEAFTVCCITIDIFCVVGAEETSWGSLKALYK